METKEPSSISDLLEVCNNMLIALTELETEIHKTICIGDTDDN